MKYKKTIILLALVVFLLSIAGVSASEIDNTIASENANTIELSTDNDIEDNLQTSEENEALTSTDYDEAIAQTDTEVLGADSATYSDLANEINQSGNITLTHKSYTYDKGETITISEDNKIIDGNGAIIDMNGSTIRAFHVNASGVTIKNLTIKNANYKGNGVAIYFTSSGTVTNCNFTNNKATGDYSSGGAIFFLSTGTVANCNFTNNSAFYGGAVEFDGTSNVTNCNFTDNDAYFGGAVFFNTNGEVTNCNFTDNTANISGGAIWIDSGTVTNCNFVNNSATREGSWGGAIRMNSGNVSNCNFTNNTATSHGGSVYFYDEGTVTNCNFADNTANKDGGAIYFLNQGTVTNCNFTDNSATVNGGAVHFNETGTVSNCNFTNNTASEDGGAVYFYSPGTVSNCNFTGNTAIDDGGAVYFENSGNVTNCNFTNNSAKNGGAVYFYNSGNLINCSFTNNNASRIGGAVYFYSSGNVIDCNFTNNSAKNQAGAIEIYGNGNVTNCNFNNNKATGDHSIGGGAIISKSGTVTKCNFTDNQASCGGAVYFFFISTDTVTNCNFIGNNATTGSAIYFANKLSIKTISNSIFLNNRANAETLEVTKNENNITITFTGNDSLLNAIYSTGDVTFTNVTYWSANGIANTDSSAPVRSNREAGQNITVSVVVNDEIVLNNVYLTDENGMIVLDIKAGENYYITARHDTDSYYTEAERTISNMTFNVNVTSQTTNNKTVNITAKSNILHEVMPGKLLFIVPNSNPINATYAGNGTWWAAYTFDDAGDYNVNASYIGLDNVTINNATIAIRYDARVDVNNKTLDLLIEDTFTIVATTTPEGLNVSYVPDDSGVYSIDENGVVTALRDGKGSILIKVEGNAGFAVNSTIVNVTVSKIPTEINVLNDTLVLAVCDEIDTGATLTPGDAGNVTYSISNSSVVKVEDGNIIALAEGKANITVSFEGNKKYLEAKNKTISVTVKLKDAKVTADDLTLDVYANATISPVTSPEGLEVEYASGNISIAEVDVNGVVTGYNAGNTTITITTKADGVHAVNSTTINVSVNTINSTIDVNDTVLNYGETTKVNVTTDGALGITAKFNGEEIIFSGYSVPIPVLNAGNYNLTVTTIPDENHKSTTKTVTITVLKQNTTADISIPANMAFGENSTVNVKLPNDASGNVTLKVDGAIVETVEVSDGSASLNISELSAGNHTVEVSYSGDDNHNPVAKTATITVYKKPTNITAAGVTTTYNINKNLVIALTDCDGNPLSDVNVTVELNTDKIYTTDENGKIVINVGSLTPNTYAATITFEGNENYTKSNTTSNVVVKKATPKMTVKAKTFKDTTKTKKYTITLKDNKGNPIKNTKVYLKVNGVTYTQTTNSKGQATFKITKLAKKGKYIATITYKGNKNYNKITKKAKITVKQTWKTISKGSKNHAMVKKIQKSLKKNGFYIKEKGRYLKIDGIFHKYTVKAVKQFQKAKKLKVTGSVDYNTAKKLKLI